MGVTAARRKGAMSPTRVLALGFLSIIIIGATLLTLPAASADGKSVGVLTALFTATSCTCVTGLAVVETGVVFSTFGHVVMLILIQVGGLGFMTAAALLFMLIGKRITLSNRLTIAEGLNESGLQGLVGLVKRVFLLTATVELSGTVLLAFKLVPLFGWGKGLWFSLFHSISAFCNAGFDLFGKGDSIVGFNSDPYVLLVFAALIIIGGLGFAVITDMWKKRGWQPLALHTKIVLVSTGALLLFGTLLFLLTEWSNPQTLGAMPVGNKITNAFFQSVTLRTAGFAAVNQSSLTNASLIMCCLLMLIGANPASTGGGIKTTTMFVVVLQVIAVIKGREDLEFAGRRLPVGIGRRAVAIICISLGVIVLLALGISIADTGSGFSTVEIVYESFSAFATVGNSMGITAALSAVSKILVIAVMFCGRVGPMTLALAFAGRMTKKNSHYPEEKIMVG